MSEQPSGSASAGASGSGGSGSGSGGGGSSNTPKVIPSLAKKQGDVTRLGTHKLKFVPTLPSRRVKEEVRKEEPPAPSTSTSTERGRGRGRGRGADRGGRGRGDGGGRGAAPRPPPVEMTASGPFAMGPALAGTSARRTAPRSNFAPIVPQGPGAAARLGAGLTQSSAPSLKREKEQEGAGAVKKEEGEEDLYSDPDEGVEIVDMDNVRQMDWMAPESLRKEREGAGKKKKKSAKVKKEQKEEGKGKGLSAEEAMDVDRQETPEEEVNMANAVDLSESEDEEELEDIIDDFAQTQLENEEASDVRQERLYFFQFPQPFPVFKMPESENAVLQGKTKAEGGDVAKSEDGGKKVSFAEDTKPPAAIGASTEGKAESTAEEQKIDGVIGQLEIYQSGAVKLRMGNGIVMDVTAATQPSFLQHAVYVDGENKRLCVLGEVNRRFIVTPDIETLLTSMELADNPPTFELGDGLLTMDTA